MSRRQREETALVGSPHRPPGHDAHAFGNDVIHRQRQVGERRTKAADNIGHRLNAALAMVNIQDILGAELPAAIYKALVPYSFVEINGPIADCLFHSTSPLSP